MTLIAQYSGNGVVDGVEIIALHRPRNRFIRIFGLTWQDFWLVLRQRAEICHFHDPELIFIGIVFRIFVKKLYMMFMKICQSRLWIKAG